MKCVYAWVFVDSRNACLSSIGVMMMIDDHDDRLESYE